VRALQTSMSVSEAEVHREYIDSVTAMFYRQRESTQHDSRIHPQ